MPDRTPPRLTARTLPPYRHVPGETPHPLRSPQGHSYRPDGEEERDLFNEGYWWECHEVMEAFWHASGMGTAAGHVLQAIIQCAAAHMKQATGHPRGARKLFVMAEDHVHQAEGVNLGLDLIGMLAETGAFLAEDAARAAQLVPLKTG